MVLGKKFDPMSDENYKQLITAENKAVNLEQRVAEIAAQLTDIDNGHLEAGFNILPKNTSYLHLSSQGAKL